MEFHPPAAQNLLTFDVILKYPNEEEKIVENVTVQILRTRNIALKDVFVELARRDFIFAENCQVMYYSPVNNWFVFCGLYPEFEVNEIPCSSLTQKRLTLRLQFPTTHNYNETASAPRLMKSTSSILSVRTGDDLDSTLDAPLSSCKTDYTASFDSDEDARPKRSAERKISHVVKAVSKWRKMFKGVPQEDGTVAKYSLDEAARKVGISKKSLDDYLLQIRYGKKFGFDFQKHKSQGIGILRAFNKKHRELAKKDPESRKTTPVIRRNRYKLVESDDESEKPTEVMDKDSVEQKSSEAVKESTSKKSVAIISGLQRSQSSNVVQATSSEQTTGNPQPIRALSIPLGSASNSGLNTDPQSNWAHHQGFQSQFGFSSPINMFGNIDGMTPVGFEQSFSCEVNGFFAGSSQGNGAFAQGGETPKCEQTPTGTTNWERERINFGFSDFTPRSEQTCVDDQAGFPFF